MTPPKTLTVSPWRYVIRPSDQLGSDTGGLCEPDKGRIFYAPDLAEDRQRETLCHEALHACFDASGLKREDEEEIISALSPAILRLLRDNPRFVEYLCE